ncbi:MAG: sulfotransferase domain-containing protein, partial [Myxococcota bacterium]
MDKALAHYMGLASLREETPHAFLWQRYEDVHADLRASVSQIAEFFRLSLDAASLDAAVDICSIDRAVRGCEAAREQLDAHIAQLRRKTRPPPRATSESFDVRARE